MEISGPRGLERNNLEKFVSLATFGTIVLYALPSFPELTKKLISGERGGPGRLLGYAAGILTGTTSLFFATDMAVNHENFLWAGAYGATNVISGIYELAKRRR